jgi:hypothetical protein
LLATFPHADFDGARKRELQRVRKQVKNNFLPHIAIDVDRLVEGRAVDDVKKSRPVHG